MPPDIILMEAIVSGRFGFNSALGHLVILGLHQLFRFQRNKTYIVGNNQNGKQHVFSVVSKMFFNFFSVKLTRNVKDMGRLLSTGKPLEN